MRGRLNRARGRRGLTLVETLVGVAVASFLLLVVASLFSTDARYRYRVGAAELLQEWETDKIRKLANDTGFTAEALAVNRDPELRACLTQPCRPECAQMKNWRPLAWDDIPIVTYYDEENRVVNDGGRFRRRGKLERCELRNEVIVSPLDEMPEYDPDCRVRLVAEWRSGPRRTIEARLRYEELGAGLSRKLAHFVALPIAAGAVDCRPQDAVYCKGAGAYLLDIDFSQQRAVCGDPITEVNRRE